MWYHISCVKIAPEKYEMIKDLENEVMWMCINCKDKVQQYLSKEDTYLKKIEDLYGKINKLLVNQPPLALASPTKHTTTMTYADISRQNSYVRQERCNIPDLIIKPKKKQDSSRTRQDVYNKINPKKLKISVIKTKETEKGELIIKCNKTTDMEIIKKEAEKELKEYEVTTSKLRLPRIKIVNFDQDLNEAEIENSIIEQNLGHEEGKIKITYIKTNKQKKTTTVFMECYPDVFKKLMSQKKVFINWQRYTIYEDISIPRCYKCQDHYHKSGDCKNRQFCAYCAQNHDVKDCNETFIQCINCIEGNKKHGKNLSINHEASSIY